MKWIGILRYFYLLGAVNALFFSILIFSKQKKNLADKILAVWLIALSLQLITPFLYLAELSRYFQFAGIEAFFYGLHPLLLYLYIKAMTGDFPKRKRLIVYILSTFAIELIFSIFFLLPAEERLNLILGKVRIQPIYYLIFAPVLVYFLAYMLLSLRTLRNYKLNTLQVYSYRENVDLFWLRRLTLFFYGLLILILPMGTALYVFDLSMAQGDYFYFAGLTIFIFFIGYWGYKQGQVFNMNINGIIQKENTVSHRHSDIQSQEINGKAQVLEKIMSEQKPFLNPTLSIFELAKLIDIQPHHLSKLINKEFNCNFFEYINRYRIESFKNYSLLHSYKDFTLLAIAFECGFNSKSAFNRIFKEQTGITPGEYKRKASALVVKSQ